jgi:hypothetical protein
MVSCLDFVFFGLRTSVVKKMKRLFMPEKDGAIMQADRDMFAGPAICRSTDKKARRKDNSI